MSTDTKDQATKAATDMPNKDHSGKTPNDASTKPGFDKKADPAIHSQTAKTDVKPVAPVSSPSYADKK